VAVADFAHPLVLQTYLVLSKNAFNEQHAWGLCIAAPVDFNDSTDDWDVRLTNGLTVRCRELRTLSQQRLLNKVEDLTVDVEKLNQIEKTLVLIIREKIGSCNILANLVGTGNEYYGPDKRVVFLATTDEIYQQANLILPIVPIRSNYNWNFDLGSRVLVDHPEGGVSKRSCVKCEDIRPQNKNEVEKPFSSAFDLTPTNLRKIAQNHEFLLLCTEKV